MADKQAASKNWTVRAAVMLTAGTLVTLGVIIWVSLLRERPLFSRGEQQPTPPPPSDRVPVAPGPDNTVTTAPPKPPREMPSAPLEPAPSETPSPDPADLSVTR